jgi:hypothetical protein
MRVRLSRSMASRYRRSASSPSLSRARDRAWTPSPQSVPLTEVISASRRKARAAASSSPLRAAASISSTKAQLA